MERPSCSAVVMALGCSVGRTQEARNEPPSGLLRRLQFNLAHFGQRPPWGRNRRICFPGREGCECSTQRLHRSLDRLRRDRGASGLRKPTPLRRLRRLAAGAAACGARFRPRRTLCWERLQPPKLAPCTVMARSPRSLRPIGASQTSWERGGAGAHCGAGRSGLLAKPVVQEAGLGPEIHGEDGAIPRKIIRVPQRPNTPFCGARNLPRESLPAPTPAASWTDRAATTAPASPEGRSP